MLCIMIENETICICTKKSLKIFDMVYVCIYMFISGSLFLTCIDYVVNTIQYIYIFCVSITSKYSLYRKYIRTFFW